MFFSRQRDRAYDAVTGVLEAPERRGDELSGVYRDHHLAFSVDGTGWCVTSRLPDGPYALQCALPGLYYAAGRHARALVRSGDPGFDDRFVVEGAPHDFVRGLFDGPLRRAARSLEPTLVQARDGRLRVVKRYSYYFAEPEHIVQAMDLAIELTDRVAAGVSALYEPVKAPAHRCDGMPYRDDTRWSPAPRNWRPKTVPGIGAVAFFRNASNVGLWRVWRTLGPPR